MELKNKLIPIIVFLLSIPFFCMSETKDTITSKLPSIYLKDINGKTVNVAEIYNNGKPILIIFWKTCCKSPVNMLDAISEVYEDWIIETGVILYAVSIDDSRSKNLIAPFVNSRGWEFEILFDPNSELKRAMNVVYTPHTFLLCGNEEIVWQKAMYIPGDEEIIYKKIIELKK